MVSSSEPGRKGIRSPDRPVVQVVLLFRVSPCAGVARESRSSFSLVAVSIASCRDCERCVGSPGSKHEGSHDHIDCYDRRDLRDRRRWTSAGPGKRCISTWYERYKFRCYLIVRFHLLESTAHLLPGSIERAKWRSSRNRH